MAENPDRYFATAAEMLMAEGMTDASEILRISTVKVEETGYDNWNGGTTIWTVYLLVSPAAYARLGTKREGMDEQIAKRLKPRFAQFTNDWYSVTIAPKVEPRPNWRHAKGDVSLAARQNVLDGPRIDQVTLNFFNGCTISSPSRRVTVVSRMRRATFGSIA